MKSTLTILAGLCLCFNSYLIASPSIKSLHKNKMGAFVKDENAYKGFSTSKGSYATFASMRSARRGTANRLFLRAANRKHSVSSKSNLTNGSIEMATNNIVYSNSTLSADSFYKTNSNENKFLIRYTKSDKGQFQYKFHIEGCVKVYEGSINSIHTYTYVSMNSAVTPDKYIIVPVNKEGYFSSDIEDDSIGSISIIKRGSDDKVIPLKPIDIEKNNSYAFDLSEEKDEFVAKVSLNNKINKTSRAHAISSNAATVYFDFNKSTLKEDTREMLDKVICRMKQMNHLSGAILEINGYADKKGSKASNLYISKMRSLACKDYLEKHGLKKVNIRMNAMGNAAAFTTGSDSNEELYDTGEKDRRVEIIVHSDVYAVNI